MAFEFTETLHLEIPSVEDSFKEFEVEEFKSNHGLITEINAIHQGLTSNFNMYTGAELEQALPSWTSPYPKPIIINHDITTEPLGRVIGARMAKEADGTPYTKLQAAILDPVAIQKVKDKRYLTGSVGGRADEAVCSICSTNWAAPREAAGAACRHVRGKLYNGKLAVIEMKGISFKEFSFVNAPADSRSIVSSVAESEWKNPVRFFILDIQKESIVECKESENIEILSEMKKKDAASTYIGIKGAFISAHADFSEFEEKAPKPYGNVKYADPKNGKYPIDNEEHVRAAWSYINVAKNASEYSPEDLAKIKKRIAAAAKKFGVQISAESQDADTNPLDNNDFTPEETVMTQAHEAQKEEDDILAVTEELSEDLSNISDAAEEEEVEVDESDSDSEEVTAEEGSEESTEVQEGSEEETERAEGQETETGDVDAETSAGAPVSREGDESEGEIEEGEPEVLADETELSESNENDELLVEELQAKVETLEVENTKLKKALHKVLAERVVDAKIAAGAVEADTRKEAVEEHSTRTAASLADALRDFAKMPKVSKTLDLSELRVEPNLQVVGDEKDVVTIGVQEDSVPVNPMKLAEDTFVDAFMGRTKL